MKTRLLFPLALLSITWNVSSCQTVKSISKEAETILKNGGIGTTSTSKTGGTTTTTTGTGGSTGSTGTGTSSRPGSTTQSGGTTGTSTSGTSSRPGAGTSTTNTTTSTTTQSGSGSNAVDFTKGEAVDAIKQALTKGITNGVNRVSVTDGFFGNSLIKIPFPESASKVESALRAAGMGNMIDKVVLTLNRAAESASKQATPIFINSIKKMTVTDAIGIVNNQQQDAATQFLQRTTTEQLVTAFKPSIKTALDQVSATKYWGDVVGYYNRLPFVSKVDTDLPDYVTRKAISGLFIMVAQEEAKIRKDPMGTASSVIQKVFGGIKIK